MNFSFTIVYRADTLVTLKRPDLFEFYGEIVRPMRAKKKTCWTIFAGRRYSSENPVAKEKDVVKNTGNRRKNKTRNKESILRYNRKSEDSFLQKCRRDMRALCSHRLRVALTRSLTRAFFGWAAAGWRRLWLTVWAISRKTETIKKNLLYLAYLGGEISTRGA